MGRSVDRSVMVGPKKFPTRWRPQVLHGGQVCVKLCLCVHADWVKEGVVMGVAYCKKGAGLPNGFTALHKI